MFDVGFWEILLILVLALVVIGPERLPGAARKAGFFVGKARRYIEGVRSEVESELDVNEFKRMLHNQEVQINELQQQLKSGIDEVKSDMPENISASDLLNDTASHSYFDEQATVSETSVSENPVPENPVSENPVSENQGDENSNQQNSSADAPQKSVTAEAETEVLASSVAAKQEKS